MEQHSTLTFLNPILNLILSTARQGVCYWLIYYVCEHVKYLSVEFQIKLLKSIELCKLLFFVMTYSVFGIIGSPSSHRASFYTDQFIYT